MLGDKMLIMGIIININALKKKKEQKKVTLCDKLMGKPSSCPIPRLIVRHLIRNSQ